jgi:hypothetical protein
MTVKELRQLIKDADLLERGLLTRLKRKQDLIDYLSKHDRVNGETSGASQPPLKRRIAKKPLSMPPVDDPSPKDVLFEQLYEKYPPLRDPLENASNDTDFRQIFHPILKNATASDMDIIFLGTASCTPGLTRGVSCTALRLNWRRRCLPTARMKIPDYSNFTGGTWLFDVGECTQVRSQLASQSTRVHMTKYEMLAPVRGQECSLCPMVMFVFLQNFIGCAQHTRKDYDNFNAVSL